MKKYSKEFIEQMKIEVETTLKTVKDIALENNIPKNTLQGWVNKYNWKRPEGFKSKLTKLRSKETIIKDDNYYKAKELYETTSIPAPEIAKQCNLTLNQFWGRVKSHNWQRSDELKSELQSNKFKKINSNYTKEERLEHNEKIRQANLEMWKNRTQEEISNIVQKRQNTMNQKSQEEIDKMNKQISKSVKYTWDNYDPQERLKINKKMSYSQQHLSPEARKLKIYRDRQTKHRNKSFKGSKTNDGKVMDSKYEVQVYEFCRRNCIPLRTQIPIEFMYKGKLHITYIDFEIDGLLFECKGAHLLQGVFDYAQPIPIEQKIKVYKENHVILITGKTGGKMIPNGNSKQSNGLKYLDKCKDPLIGVDIELFRNPPVPYDITKPKCFYDVKVDGKRSVNEAWGDELLRWKMIKNRINYVGGFIDNKSILTAMNVTRTCKQPSWFDKNFAKQLIQKYITTNTVIDPFAGWGTRCDACKELGLTYYGWDLNEELVDWHTSMGRTFVGDSKCGINYGDANYVKSDMNNCSVFICPPYTDKEVYFDGQDTNKTQCQWLETVRQNIPNAKEYLMVCKVVDNGYEKYIVEEKINKSHLGTNKEYVLLIKNS